MKLLAFLVLAFSASLCFADYDPAQAIEYASASALAYCHPESIESWTCGAPCHNLTGYQPYYSEVVQVNQNESLAVAMIYNTASQKFVTAFRGTAGSYQLFLEILQGNSIPFTLVNISGAEADDYFYHHYDLYFRSNVTEQIQKAYASFPNYEFVFTGHSLGGALTTFACFDMISSGILPRQNVILYNYGSPRVGNQILAHAIEAAVPEIYRVVHWKDIVPHLPPCHTENGKCVPTNYSMAENPNGYLWPAWHVSQEVFYNENNTDYKFCDGGEDPNCADQFLLPETLTSDHGYYVGIHVGCDSSSGFDYEENKILITMEDFVTLGIIKGNEI